MTQETALNILKTGASVFLTGSAGTGKTYVLNQYITFLRLVGVAYAVTASTGIAATHIGGMTIHSWSGMGVRNELSEYDIDAIEKKQYLYKRLTKTDVLIIDEISMLHQSQLDSLDRLLRSVRKDKRPFGGLQMIFCGDFFQLPPITRAREVTAEDFVFTADSWRRLDPVICYLTHQYRQSEGNLNFILESMRDGDLSDELFTLLESRKDVVHEPPFTRLYTHNVDVDTENNLELAKLKADEKAYEMNSSGKEALVLGLKKNCLAPERLVVRIGAHVMFVKNDPEHSYMNGTIGIVKNFSKEGGFPVVELDTGRHIIAEPVDWSIEEEGKIKARITQVPLRLAWAMTVHKSQGMSLDKAVIDLSKAFTFGQGYVALSRLRTLEGLSLSGFSTNALAMHPEVKTYDEGLQKLSALAEQVFETLGPEVQETRQREYITRIGGVWPKEGQTESVRVKNMSENTYETTRRLLEEVDSLEALAEERDLSLQTILKHCEVLKEEGTLPDLKRFNLINEGRLEILVTTFRELKTDKLTPVLEYLRKADFETNYDELRIARLFV